MMDRVLVVDDDQNLRFAFRRILDPQVFTIDEAAFGEEALALARTQSYSVVFLDLRMPGMPGMEVLARLQQIDNKVPVIIMTAFGTTDTAIEAVKSGAYDFILKPFEIEDIQQLAAQAAEAHRLMARKVGLPSDHAPLPPTEEDSLVGRTRSMQEVYKQIGQVAQTDANVLITGASGTGKELVARAIYHHSRRADKPFLAVNCAAIPEGLLESELFGHERGAFTSAEHRRLGRFERADGGTLFLDEIGDMSMATQAKILRVLQDGVVERVGGHESIRVDVRVIAATHRDLPRRIRKNLFREDLYFRLNVFTIDLPSLVERRDDIPLLARYFVERGSKRLNKEPPIILPETMDKLKVHSWRGNVRELENVVDRALIVTTGPSLLPEAIVLADEPELPRTSRLSLSDRNLFDLVFERLAAQYRRDQERPILAALEQEMLLRATRFEKGNQVQAARLLGISRQTLRNRLAEAEAEAAARKSSEEKGFAED
ncbi:MAG TPA: sigma-54 dependent transcriptional regulator [Acidobacteriota bacterium]|nr:sigma-54 dependent transcriptional regulator [Acidobacteriota bacterium]